MFLLTCAAKVASTGRVLARAHVQQNDLRCLVRAEKFAGFSLIQQKRKIEKKLSKNPVFAYDIKRDPKQPQKAPGASAKRQRANRTGGCSVKPVSLLLIGGGVEVVKKYIKPKQKNRINCLIVIEYFYSYDKFYIDYFLINLLFQGAD